MATKRSADPATDARAADKEVRQEPAAYDHNAVLLVGRLAGRAAERELPSGDTMVTFRLVVRRTCDHGRRAPRSPTIDTIDCVSWNPAALGDWDGWGAGDIVSVAGCLRRRFWRAGAAVASRYEVDVHQASCTPGSTGQGPSGSPAAEIGVDSGRDECVRPEMSVV